MSDPREVARGKQAEREEKHAVIQREDPQASADVEVAEIVDLPLRVVEDARDQEPGEHEEEVHPAAAEVEQLGEDLTKPGRVVRPEVEVVGHHEQDGQPSDGVQGGDMTVKPEARRHGWG